MSCAAAALRIGSACGGGCIAATVCDMTIPGSMVKQVLLVKRTNQLLWEPTPRSRLRQAVWATGETVCQRLPYGYTAPMTKAMTKTDKPARLSAEDWAQAALDVVADRKSTRLNSSH